MNKNKLIVTIAVIGTCVAFVAISTLLRDKPSISVGNPRVIGPPDAEVKIVEYVDFQCGACKQAASILKEYVKKYPGRILLEAKSYPLAGHKYGALSAQYAHCAAEKGGFWPFYDLLFESQAEWSVLPDVPAAQARFKELSKRAGLDPRKMAACAEAPATLEAVAREREIAFSVGVRSTPTFFVNGVITVGGKGLRTELDRYFPNDKPAGQPS